MDVLPTWQDGRAALHEWPNRACVGWLRGRLWLPGGLVFHGRRGRRERMMPAAEKVNMPGRRASERQAMA